MAYKKRGGSCGRGYRGKVVKIVYVRAGKSRKRCSRKKKRW